MTEPSSNQKKLATVRALLNKAFDPAATEEEKTSFQEKAHELIARYGIDAAKLAGPSQEDELTVQEFWIEGEYALDRRVLFYRIGHVFRCKNLLGKKQEGNRYRLTLYGYRSDIERVEFLYSILQLQALTEMRKAEMPYYLSNKVSFNKSWLSGFTAEVTSRLREAERRAVAEETASGTPGMAMVLVSRKDRVEAYMKSQLDFKPRTIKAPTRGLDGYFEGRAAGERASLNETQLGERRVRITAGS